MLLKKFTIVFAIFLPVLLWSGFVSDIYSITVEDLSVTSVPEKRACWI